MNASGNSIAYIIATKHMQLWTDTLQELENGMLAMLWSLIKALLTYQFRT